jgi:diguanylate cyclase (GGDEF)-like protein/PAS domain S-box-containing protein
MRSLDTRAAAMISFTAVGAVGVVSVFLPPRPHDLRLAALAAAGLAVLALLTFCRYRRPTPEGSWALCVPSLLFLGLLAVLTEAAGGVSAGLAPLVGLPALWIALYGTSKQLYLVAACTGLFFTYPLLRHDQDYPMGEWRRAVLWMLVVAVICPTIQKVVRRLAEVAAEQGQLAESLSAILRAATEHAVIATDRDGTITLFSEGAERMLGYRADEVVGRLTPSAFHDPGELSAVASGLGVHPDSVVLRDIPAEESLTRQWTYLHRDGTRKAVQLTISRLRDADGGQAGWAGIARDVTAEQRVQNRFERLFEESPTGAVLLAADGTIQRVNPALQAMIGRDARELLGRRPDTLPFVQTQGQTPLLPELLADRRQRVQGERVITHSAGHQVHVLASAVTLRDNAGRAEGVLAHLVDISEHKRYEEHLAHLAEHDPLTGLANRRKLDSELTSHLDRCGRYGATGALLMLDLDNFKQVNDTLGHSAGDQLIGSLGAVLRQRMRAGDVVARLGGDEFAVLLPQADRPAAEAVAQDILDLTRSDVRLLGQPLPGELTASIGVVLIDDPKLSPGEILSTADLTMYDAKDGGRDRYVVHAGNRLPAPRGGARVSWADRISQAVRENRLVVHAQPVQDLRTGRVTGAELLVRMVGDGGELIMPGRFLYIAERTDLIHQLDAWMIDQAVEVLQQAQAIDPAFSIEVNVSGRSLGDPAPVDRIATRLREHAVDPHGLVLEITETAAVCDIAAARAFATRIHGVGCRFALDDFGAGSGSFSYLKHLLFDFVKIDGEFVTKAAGNPTDQLIVSSIVGIARGLGKQTVAEFVTDAETLDLVRTLGVDRAQGYHVGRPEPVPALLDRVRSQPTAAPIRLPRPRVPEHH